VCSSGGPLTFTVQTSGGAQPPSTGITVSADLSVLGLGSAQALYDDGTNGDAVAGDGVFTYTAAIPGGRPLAPVTVVATISDAQSRNGTASIPVAVGDCSNSSAARVVISQIYGGGGNPGIGGVPDGVLDSDFVELYNRSAQTVDLTGWSVQYASPASVTGFDDSGDQVLLSGSIQPGQHVLVRM